MAGLIFIIPAVILMVIGILLYVVFALLIGSFSVIGAAHKVAPQKIGFTVAIGIITTFVAYAFLGNSGGILESGLIFLISLCIGSVAMLVLALVFSATATDDGQDLNFKEQPLVEHQTTTDKAAGGWGLRKSAYSDGQHREAQKQHDKNHMKEQKNRASNINNPF